jgi:hypothetical protein
VAQYVPSVVPWLSEICSGDGLQLLRVFLQSSATPQVSTLRYPKQGFPPSPAWKLWKPALSGLCDSNQILYSSLGNWLRATTWSYDPVRNGYTKSRGHLMWNISHSGTVEVETLGPPSVIQSKFR